MGGKPSKGTKADKRLTANKAKSGGKSPAFGSAAWNAKYGIGKGKKGK